MLQVCAALAPDGAASEFRTIDDNLSCRRRIKTQRAIGTDRRGGVVGQLRSDAEPGESAQQDRINSSVGGPPRHRRRERERHAVRHLACVQQGTTTGRATDGVQASSGHRCRGKATARQFVSSEGHCWRTPRITTPDATLRCARMLQQGGVDGHVSRARRWRTAHRLPARRQHDSQRFARRSQRIRGDIFTHNTGGEVRFHAG